MIQLLQFRRWCGIQAQGRLPSRSDWATMAQMTRVFISSTFDDLRAERHAVERALHRLQDSAFAGMEYFGSRPDSPLTASLGEVDRSDVYVGIFGHRYGSGITEAEYHRARERGLPCLIFMAESGPPSAAEPDRVEAARLEALKRELSREHVVEFFEEPQELAVAVIAALHNYLRERWPARPISPATRHNLPAEVSSFVGRAREIAHIKQLLQETRLLSLTGTGGAGKTRLALHTALEFVDSYPDGVWLVELGSLQEPTLVPLAVASALGVLEERRVPLITTLTEYLRPKELLLVLDNCEHVLDACAALVEHLLRGCPQLKVLTTSRAILGLVGEQVWRVPSMSAPPPPPPPPQPHHLSRYEAVQLFLDRARAAHSDFVLTAGNAPALAQLCHHLDGIPLAIELAAARVRLLTVVQIADRLADRFRLLTGGNRSLPRHQTLRAAIDWSHDLLGDSERTLFARLSVFVDGCTLTAAESVCAGDGIESDDVLDLLCRLIDHSLLITDEAGPTSRYRMLETVREYGRERLAASGTLERFRSAHAGHFLELAKSLRPQLERLNEQGPMRLLEDEQANLRVALDWFERTGDGDLGLQMAGALRRWWECRGTQVEARARLERLLTLPTTKTSSPARVDALVTAASMANGSGDVEETRRLARTAVAMSHKLPYLRGLADAEAMLGCAARAAGEPSAARTHFEASLHVSRRAGYLRGTGSALTDLATVASLEGRLDDAEVRYRECLALWEQLDDQVGIAWVNFHLGRIAYERDDYDAARSHLSVSTAIQQDLGDVRAWGHSLSVLGLVELALGAHARAKAHLEIGLRMWRASGEFAGGVADLLDALARVAMAEGDYDVARGHLDESLAIRSELGLSAGAASSLALLAQIEARADEYQHALRLAGAAKRFASAPLDRHTAFVTPGPRIDEEVFPRLLAQGREVLGEATAEEAFEAGGKMSLGEAVAEARTRSG
jgi:predicted ATPase